MYDISVQHLTYIILNTVREYTILTLFMLAEIFLGKSILVYM